MKIKMKQILINRLFAEEEKIFRINKENGEWYMLEKYEVEPFKLKEEYVEFGLGIEVCMGVEKQKRIEKIIKNLELI